MGTRDRVYLLHGLLGTSRYHCARQIEAWQSRFDVVPIDLPGHGQSTKDASVPYVEDAVDAVASQIETHGSGHIVAISYLGSAVACRAIPLIPGKVTSVVLAGIVTDIPEEIFKPWTRSFIELADQNPRLREWYERMHGKRWRGTLEAYCEDVDVRYQSAALVRGRAIGDLGVLTLIINGEKKSNERAMAHDAASLAPSVRGCVVPGAGHIVCMEQPDIFNWEVERFWMVAA